MGAAPLAIVEARGAHVFDQSGRRFIDWIGAWGPALLGHANPEMRYSSRTNVANTRLDSA